MTNPVNNELAVKPMERANSSSPKLVQFIAVFEALAKKISANTPVIAAKNGSEPLFVQKISECKTEGVASGNEFLIIGSHEEMFPNVEPISVGSEAALTVGGVANFLKDMKTALPQGGNTIISVSSTDSSLAMQLFLDPKGKGRLKDVNLVRLGNYDDLQGVSRDFSVSVPDESIIEFEEMGVFEDTFKPPQEAISIVRGSALDHEVRERLIERLSAASKRFGPKRDF